MKKWMFSSLIIFGSITLFAANDNLVDLLKILSISQKDTLLEAGHAFQNMNLMASACNISAVNIGAFFDEEIGTLLQITPGEEVPIYATILGVKDDDY